MSSNITKKDIKNSSRDFRTIANRVLNSDYDAFDDNLKRLIYHIDNNSLIKEFIVSCIDEEDKFDIENDVKQVSGGYGDYIFESFIEEAKEISYTYQLLKYITENSISYRNYIYPYSASRQYQDKVKGFNDKVVLPLINSIDGNYERICVEMGYDETGSYNITINGGQVNIAKDNASITAVQNNNNVDELVNNVKQKLNEIKEKELKEEIIDNVEGIQEEIKKDQIKKGKIKAFISSLKLILPKVKTAIELTTAISEIITFAQNYIK